MAALVVLRHVAVHDDASPVHAGRAVTAEGVHGQVERLALGCSLVEHHVLTGQHCFAGNEVRIHLFPATGQRATVEDDLQAVAVGVVKNVLVKLHGLLLVATEEVYLDAFHADALQPLHFLIARHAAAHAITGRLRRIVLVAVAVVPEHQADAFRLRVLRQLGYALTTDGLIPPIIHQTILKPHRGGQVNELHLVVVVDALVLPDEPAPRVASGLVVLRRLIERIHEVVADGGLDDGCQRRAYGDGAPRRLERQRYAGRGGADAVVLTLHGEGYLVRASLRLPFCRGHKVAEVATHVAAVNTRLADEHPCRPAEQASGHTEQRREHKAVSVL